MNALKAKSFRIVRIGVGVAAFLLGLSLFVYTYNIASVRNEFRRLPDLSDEEYSSAFLSDYSLKLDRLLRRDPSNGLIRNRYAAVLARQGEYRNARRQHEQALQTHHTHDSLFFLGNVYDKLGDITTAEQVMQRGAIINPSDPQFNAAHLRLLNQRVLTLRTRLQQADPSDPGYESLAGEFQQAWQVFAEGSRNWGIRAPHDKNSYLFLANYYVGPPLFPELAYRNFLLGLSQAFWMDLNPEWMIERRQALSVISTILRGGWADAYRDLP